MDFISWFLHHALRHCSIALSHLNTQSFVIYVSRCPLTTPWLHHSGLAKLVLPSRTLMPCTIGFVCIVILLVFNIPAYSLHKKGVADSFAHALYLFHLSSRPLLIYECNSSVIDKSSGLPSVTVVKTDHTISVLKVSL